LHVVWGITLMSVLGIPSVTPAFPSVSEAFGLSSGQVYLLISVFSLPGLYGIAGEGEGHSVRRLGAIRKEATHMVEEANYSTSGEGGEGPVGTVYGVDPHPLNWLYITLTETSVGEEHRSLTCGRIPKTKYEQRRSCG
ncbi:MAG: hypothetical protein H0T55_00990, partial [Rubrobacteraceae bacterium]|nr:hypothetical protein [Rubrobacteraceae bacterium]